VTENDIKVISAATT